MTYQIKSPPTGLRLVDIPFRQSFALMTKPGDFFFQLQLLFFQRGDFLIACAGASLSLFNFGGECTVFLVELFDMRTQTHGVPPNTA